MLREQRVVEARDVADGPHVLDAGLEALVDDHAVVELEAAALEPARDRCDADADDRELGLDDPSARRLDRIERRAPAERLHLVAEHELDAFTGVQVGEELHQLARAQNLEQALAAMHERHFEPELLQRRGDLHADETRADDHRVPRTDAPLADRRRVVERAQRVDAFQIGAGNVEASRRGAARDQQLVERPLASVFEQHAATLQVEGRDDHVELDLDAVLCVERLGLDERVGDLRLTPEVLLGERRPVIRDERVGGKQPHRPVASGLAVRLDRPRGRKAAADDQELLALGHRRHGNDPVSGRGRSTLDVDGAGHENPTDEARSVRRVGIGARELTIGALTTSAVVHAVLVPQHTERAAARGGLRGGRRSPPCSSPPRSPARRCASRRRSPRGSSRACSSPTRSSTTSPTVRCSRSTSARSSSRPSGCSRRSTRGEDEDVSFAPLTVIVGVFLALLLVSISGGHHHR